MSSHRIQPEPVRKGVRICRCLIHFHTGFCPEVQNESTDGGPSKLLAFEPIWTSLSRAMSHISGGAWEFKGQYLTMSRTPTFIAGAHTGAPEEVVWAHKSDFLDVSKVSICNRTTHAPRPDSAPRFAPELRARHHDTAECAAGRWARSPQRRLRRSHRRRG